MIFSISTFIKAVAISCRQIDGCEKDKNCDSLHHFESFWFFSSFFFKSKFSSWSKSLQSVFLYFLGQIVVLSDSFIVYSNGKVAELKALAEKFEYFFHKK